MDWISNERVLISDGGEETLCPPERPVQIWVPLILAFNGYWGYFARIKRPGREVDHSSPSNADVKNEWICASTPPRRGV